MKICKIPKPTMYGLSEILQSASWLPFRKQYDLCIALSVGLAFIHLNIFYQKTGNLTHAQDNLQASCVTLK